MGMTLNEFKEKLFARASQEGFEEYEIYYVDGESFAVAVYNKEIDKYDVNTTLGLSFRGKYQGKMGYAYTEVLDDEAVELLIKNAKANAVLIENEDEEVIYGEQEHYAQLDGFNPELSRVEAEEVIRLTLDMEEKAFARSDKVKAVQYCDVELVAGSCRIINSKGLDVSYRSNHLYGFLVPVVQDGNRRNTAVAFKGTKRFEEFRSEELAREAVDDALAHLGGETVESGKYRIALRNDAAAQLLSTFAGIFSADNVQKGMSLLKGKVGTVIASPKVTILDDPLMKDGACSTPFDAEGVATYTKEVIKEGVLQTLLHNLKTALKDGVKSTGNASKASFKSPVNVSPTNFYVQPGELGFDEILAELGDGLLITDLQGTHSGANPVSGDFSLAAKGFLVGKGKIQRPVEQITVAGNFYKVLEDIEAVASDLKFGFPSGSGCCGSPTLLIKELSIAGK